MLELKVDGFSGPLDLLLDLIEREQLDITVLSLAQVAAQYWPDVRGGEPFTGDEKIGELSLALERTGGRLAFRKLLAACETRTEIVVLFLAVLEMIKGGRLWAEQDRPFGDITLAASRPE